MRACIHMRARDTVLGCQGEVMFGQRRWDITRATQLMAKTVTQAMVIWLWREP